MVDFDINSILARGGPVTSKENTDVSTLINSLEAAGQSSTTEAQKNSDELGKTGMVTPVNSSQILGGLGADSITGDINIDKTSGRLSTDATSVIGNGGSVSGMIDAVSVLEKGGPVSSTADATPETSETAEPAEGGQRAPSVLASMDSSKESVSGDRVTDKINQVNDDKVKLWGTLGDKDFSPRDFLDKMDFLEDQTSKISMISEQKKANDIEIEMEQKRAETRAIKAGLLGKDSKTTGNRGKK